MQWHDDRVTRTVYSTDNSIYQVRPERVSVPTEVPQIARALRSNYESGRPGAIVARGGGTGTNGQSLTSGSVIDLKRGLHRLLSIDPERRVAIVQPGLVAGALNGALSEHGLFWAPHTSTLNRATVGGMISTDAAGKGSMVHGRAHRHVERLTVLLDDGSEFVAEAVTLQEAERRAAAPGRAGQVWAALLELDVADDGELGLPELARGFSGYGLDRLRTEDGRLDPVALLCGAEGTLGIVVEATLKLTPLPTSTRLMVATYDSFTDALEDSVELRAAGPAAIECFDGTTLGAGRSSPAWPALASAIGDVPDLPGAVLLLEFVDTDQASPALDMLKSGGRCRSQAIVEDPGEQARIWKVRADAVGLLARVAVGGPERSARPTAFVEDCAVPVAEMASFIAGFRSILDDAGLTYAMFGHADVGCVHVRPALDLTNPDERRLVAEVTAAVVELVHGHGGILWGEHGRGLRGASAERVLSARALRLMGQVKAIFDPFDIFNPGKLYRPAGADEPITPLLGVGLRGELDQQVDISQRRHFGDAFACNGNGLCHHHDANEAMCPSFKATGDPALSPKGRADLLRSWLHDAEPDPSFEDQLATNLSQCLSCSACTGQCPVQVDIPELKSRFLERYYENRRRPLNHRVLGRFEEFAVLAARFPALAKAGIRVAGPLLGLVDLPGPKAPDTDGAVTRWSPSSKTAAECDVVLLPDVFTHVLDPAVEAAAVRVLEGLGYRVAVADLLASGKFDHVKGRRKRFAQAARSQRDLVEAVVSAGAEPFVIEPAVAMLHQCEYPAVIGDHPGTRVRSVAELIERRLDRLGRVAAGDQVRVLGHCTERMTSPNTAAAWSRVLTAAGYRVDAPRLGCCGMAGIFGHEAANAAMSRDLWDLSWASQIESAAADAAHVVAPGYSCRSQVERFSDGRVRHPLQLLRAAAEGDRRSP